LNAAELTKAVEASFWKKGKMLGLDVLDAAGKGCTFNCSLAARDIGGLSVPVDSQTAVRAVKVLTLTFTGIGAVGSVVFGESFVDAGVQHVGPSGELEHHRTAAVPTRIIPRVLCWTASPTYLVTDETLENGSFEHPKLGGQVASIASAGTVLVFGDHFWHTSSGSWVLGLGSWVLVLGSWVLGLGSWVLGLTVAGVEAQLAFDPITCLVRVILSLTASMIHFVATLKEAVKCSCCIEGSRAQ
jgi:hypothetical protein